MRYAYAVNGLYFSSDNQNYRRGISTSILLQKDYHQVLGLNSNATKQEIRSKFLELCKLHHPDKVISGDVVEKEKQKIKFQEVNEAYERLSKTDTTSVHDTDYKYGATSSKRYSGGNYSGYTQYNRRRYEGKKPWGSEDTNGWHSTWNESDRYKDEDYWKKYSEDEFYRQQYDKNKKRWDDDMNKWSAYRNFTSKSNPYENFRPRGTQYTNAQVVRACVFLLILSFIFHIIESMAYQRETDNYYDRSRQYYKDYDILRGKVNREDLNERTLFIERLKNSSFKSD